MMPTYRPAALAAAVLALSGCSSLSGDYNQYGQMLKLAWQQGLSKGSVTLEQAAAIPYASMGWRLNGGNQNIVVLATDNAEGQLWTSAAHVVLLTDHGRIKRTVGLPRNMASLASERNGAMAPPAAALRAGYEEHRVADFPDLGAFSAQIDCVTAARGAQSVTILGKAIAAVRVEERCVARNLNWRFTNIFWVDRDSGMVWQSLQHIHPKGDTLETEIFRPPG